MLPSSFMNKSNNKLSLSLGQHWPLSSYLELVLCLNRSSSSWTLSVVSMIHRKWTWSAVDASLFVKARTGILASLSLVLTTWGSCGTEQTVSLKWALNQFPEWVPFCCSGRSGQTGQCCSQVAARAACPVPPCLSSVHGTACAVAS